jgi:hypothetical protein
MTIRNSNRGLKAALTVKKRQLTSASRMRFPRADAKQLGKQLAHWSRDDGLRASGRRPSVV